MKAFHNDQTIKDKYLSRVRAHQLADEIIKGHYWENGKGCAVGCTIHDSNHKKYETELGIPEWLAKLEDSTFEGLPNERAKLWPFEFLESIPVGADLDKIKAPFMVFILKSTLDKFDHIKFPKVLKSIQDIIGLYETGETDLETFRTAATAATAAADSDAYAATASSAAAAAAAAAAAYAASYAAYAADSDAYAATATAAAASYAAAADAAAAYAASYAASAADSDAYAATASSAAAAADASAAASAARENNHVAFADELLRLIKGLA